MSRLPLTEPKPKPAPLPAPAPANWASPDPAADDELRRHPLPCDVQVGNTVFRKGTALLLLVEHHRALYGRVYPTKD
jgi:hypothetical protein